MQTAKEGANLLRQTNDSIVINLARGQSSANGESPLAQEQIKTDFSEIIAENFGANATYVETLLARWQSNPALVDESWRAYFEELIGPNGEGVRTAKAEPAAAPQTAGDGAAVAKAPAQKTNASKPQPTATESRPEVIPIRGAA